VTSKDLYVFLEVVVSNPSFGEQFNNNPNILSVYFCFLNIGAVFAKPLNCASKNIYFSKALRA
jgi:hypothetical protein